MINIEIVKTYSIFLFLLLHLFLIPNHEFDFFIYNVAVTTTYLVHFLFSQRLYSLNVYGYIILLFQCIHISFLCKFLYPLYFFLGLEFSFFFYSNHLFLSNFDTFFLTRKNTECIICYENCNIFKHYNCCKCVVCHSCSKQLFKCPICREYY